MARADNSKNIKIFAGIVVTAIVFALLFNNLSAPVTVSQQTYNTPNGQVTTLTKTCGNVIIKIGDLCQLSNNESPVSLNNNTSCSNGQPLNGICPASVIPLPANTTLPSNPTPPPPPPSAGNIQLLALVTATDSKGVSQKLVANPLNLPLGAFTAIQNQNTDFTNGKIDIQLQLKTPSPNQQVTGNGTMFVSYNGEQLNPNGIQFAFFGSSSSNSTLIANLGVILNTNALRQGSPTYKFDLTGKQINNGLNPLIFTLSNIKISVDGKSYSKADSQQLFQVNIEHDPNIIFIKDASGNNIRGYPNDDTLNICGENNVSHTSTFINQRYNAVQYNLDTYTYTIIGGLGKTTVSKYLPSNPSYEVILGVDDHIAKPIKLPLRTQSNLYPSYVYAGTYETYQSGAYCTTINNIPRNDDIHIVSDIGNTNVRFHTPVEQKTWTITCKQGQACTIPTFP